MLLVADLSLVPVAIFSVGDVFTEKEKYKSV